MKILFDLNERLPKMQAAYLAGSLTAQQRHKPSRYAYRKQPISIDQGVTCCVIGSGMTEDELDFLDANNISHNSIETLSIKGIVVFPNEAQLSFAKDLQRVHDKSDRYGTDWDRVMREKLKLPPKED